MANVLFRNDIIFLLPLTLWDGHTYFTYFEFCSTTVARLRTTPANPYINRKVFVLSLIFWNFYFSFSIVYHTLHIIFFLTYTHSLLLTILTPHNKISYS